MAENEFLFDLKHSAETMPFAGRSHNYFPNGQIASEVRLVTPPEGEHGLYWCLDTLMHKNPPEMDSERTTPMSHFHYRGYETFFVDSGSLYLFVNGQRTVVKKGDIIHLQPGQAQAMYFLDDVKWRGTYHDFEVYPEGRDVARLRKMMPELADDPEVEALQPRGFMDSNKIEPFLTVDVPPEQCVAVKNLSRPHASYAFPGCTMNVVVERWENGGVKELDCAVLEPGFTAAWEKYPRIKELFYVRSGKVKFTIMGRTFVADDECVVVAPRFAPRSIEALERTELYELGGQAYWSLFLQNVASIRKYDPARLTRETMEALKQRFVIPIAGIGMK